MRRAHIKKFLKAFPSYFFYSPDYSYIYTPPVQFFLPLLSQKCKASPARRLLFTAQPIT